VSEADLQHRRWQQVQELFAAVAELPPEERARHLGRHCADAAVRAEVESLLASDVAADGFLESAIAAGSALFEADRDPLARRARVGKYELAERIGAGGFGAVWRAEDPLLGRQVAIKSCTSEDPKLRQRFLREAQIAARLQHPHITTVFDFGQQDDVPYLVQELLPGEDLAQQIRRRPTTTLAARLDILVQVGAALAYAHRRGVLHRDVKPANVRILPEGTAKLMDFGIAKLVHDDSGSGSGLTSGGVAFGTIGYMSPEQLNGEPPDRRSDIFAFGVLAYELLTYEQPFGGSSFSEVSLKLLEKEPPPLRERCPECPRGLAALVERCLVKDPAGRWQSMEPVVEGLEAMLAAIAAGREPPELAELPPTAMPPVGPAATAPAKVTSSRRGNAMTPLPARKAVCLVAANVVALLTSGIALMTVILSGGSGFAAAGESDAAMLVFAVGIGLTLLLLSLAAVRGERPLSGYLSPITSLLLFVLVSYFLLD
jgi:serine/threonine-protein kinase